MRPEPRFEASAPRIRRACTPSRPSTPNGHTSGSRPEPRGPRGHLALQSAALTGALLSALICSAVARAGTWALVSCATPGGAPAPAAGWLAGGAGDDKGSTNTCGAPGGALVAQVGDQAEQPAYQPATWTFTAPAGSAIAGGSLQIGFFTPEGQGYAETPENSYDAGDVLANCQYNTGTCASQWNNETVPINASHAGGTQIFVGAECVAPIEGDDYCQRPGDPVDAADGVDAQTDLYAAVIELANDATPSASGFAGGLLVPNASGVQDLLFAAQDPNGPGIYNVTVTIDGQVVYDQIPNTNGGQCQSVGTDPSGALEFLSLQPCRQTLALSIPVNTAQFAAGAHQLTVTETDAAGNTATVYSQTITTAQPNLPNGTPCPSPTLSLTANRKTRLAPVRWGTRVVIGGWLHCQQSAIANANLTLSGDGTIRSVATSADGRFTLTLPRGPSRTLRFGYRAYSDDTSPTAAASIAIRVYPRITLQITPRATANLHTILWLGDVAGGPYPPGGLTLLVEVREGRRWQSFDQLTTHNGTFEYRYTFLRTTASTTYEFRVAMPSSGAAGYRYLPAASRAIAVHVSP